MLNVRIHHGFPRCTLFQPNDKQIHSLQLGVTAVVFARTVFPRSHGLQAFREEPLGAMRVANCPRLAIAQDGRHARLSHNIPCTLTWLRPNSRCGMGTIQSSATRSSELYIYSPHELGPRECLPDISLMLEIPTCGSSLLLSSAREDVIVEPSEIARGFTTLWSTNSQ